MDNFELYLRKTANQNRAGLLSVYHYRTNLSDLSDIPRRDYFCGRDALRGACLRVELGSFESAFESALSGCLPVLSRLWAGPEPLEEAAFEAAACLLNNSLSNSSLFLVRSSSLDVSLRVAASSLRNFSTDFFSSSETALFGDVGGVDADGPALAADSAVKVLFSPDLVRVCVAGGATGAV